MESFVALFLRNVLDQHRRVRPTGDLRIRQGRKAWLKERIAPENSPERFLFGQFSEQFPERPFGRADQI